VIRLIGRRVKHRQSNSEQPACEALCVVISALAAETEMFPQNTPRRFR
jgi:hypothetical protein